MTLWRGDALAARARGLGALLAEWEPLWRERAFYQPRPAWTEAFPALAGALRALPVEQAEALAADDDALTAWLRPHLPVAGELAELSAIGRFPATGPLPPPGEPRDMPGRKREQIDALLACLPPGPLPGLEWCAGKAHLGRRFSAARGVAVTALERDPALVAQARRLAGRERLPVQGEICDVLGPGGLAALAPDQQVLALHACGDLHLHLLRCCALARPRAVALAPCCYHLTAAPRYQPLAATLAGTGPRPDRGALRTAVQQSATAPAREQRRRRQLQAWRLGFDLLQRELRGVDDYLPTPPLPPAVLAEGFAACCARLAAGAGLALPARVDYAAYERAGARRFAEVTAFDLTRMLFRRPLELWLVADRALYLAEQGYAVAVGRFCPAPLTPRNLLIRAER